MRKEDMRLKILFLCTWYPNKENRVAGVFVREHAQACPHRSRSGEAGGVLALNYRVADWSGVLAGIREVYWGEKRRSVNWEMKEYWGAAIS